MLSSTSLACLFAVVGCALAQQPQIIQIRPIGQDTTDTDSPSPIVRVQPVEAITPPPPQPQPVQQADPQSIRINSPLLSALFQQVQIPVQYAPAQPSTQAPPRPQFYQPAPVQPVQPVPAAGDSQPSMTTIDCKGTLYLVSAEQAKFYSCCGPSIYYWPTHQCKVADDVAPPPVAPSPIAIVPAPVPAPAPQTRPGNSQPAATLTCNGVQYQFNTPNALQRYACCGKSVYDVQTSRCNDTSLPPMPDFGRLFPNMMGMNQNAFYNPYQQRPAAPLFPFAQPPAPAPQPLDSGYGCEPSYTCCSGFRPVYDPQRAYRCCPGAGIYDPSVSSCVAAS